MVAGRPPLGFARLEMIDNQAHLAQLAVNVQYARQGIGRSLVLAAKAWAQEAGFHSISLTTFKDVPFNAAFYATCGFVTLAESQWGRQLADLRRQEFVLGLDQLGTRVAMAAALGGDDGSGQRRFLIRRHT